MVMDTSPSNRLLLVSLVEGLADLGNRRVHVQRVESEVDGLVGVEEIEVAVDGCWIYAGSWMRL